MNTQTATDEEYAYMLTALKGLSTAMNHPKLAAAVEKIAALTKKKDNGLFLDFSVLRERGPLYADTAKSNRKQKSDSILLYKCGRAHV